MAGEEVMATAKRSGRRVLPVDSEHNAIFQCLEGKNPSTIKRLILTCSGGPFRKATAKGLASVTPEQALRHPTWSMGRKISIDSATLFNKGLEMIEARWLFNLVVDEIGVMIHPQSIVHSFVEFVDGSVLAQLSPPDMKLPIQYALTYPERWIGTSRRLDWSQSHQLDFFPPDLDAFPALRLGFEVAKRGGTCGSVLNAANEVAVERFLDGSLKFTEIPQACGDILNGHNFDAQPTLAELLRLDEWARKEMQQWKSSQSI